MAASQEVAEHHRRLGLAWIKLAQKERVLRASCRPTSEVITTSPFLLAQHSGAQNTGADGLLDYRRSQSRL